MAGVRGERKRPAEFRACPVLIGQHGQSYDQARFVPPDSPEVGPRMLDLERFLRNPGRRPVVVQIALAHYQFETIHPFMDGNGRLGRLLISLMLCDRGALTQPLLYLSVYLEAHDQEYRDGLLSVSRNGTWAEWIRFIAAGVAERAEDAGRRAQELMAARERYRQLAQAAKKPAATLALIDQLFAAPAVTVPGAVRVMTVVYSTAQRCIDWLVEVGVLEEASGRTRNRVYIAPEIVRLLDAVPPPAPV